MLTLSFVYSHSSLGSRVFGVKRWGVEAKDVIWIMLMGDTRTVYPFTARMRGMRRLNKRERGPRDTRNTHRGGTDDGSMC